MNTNLNLFLLCPIPADQKPINEYIEIKESFFTNWTTFSPVKYNQKLFSLFFNLFIIISIIRIGSFQGFYYFFEWLFEDLFISTTIGIFLLFMILFRWLKLLNTFDNARLFYEEASWYDGQIWEKPLSLIKSDNLIKSQKLFPIVTRIQKTLTQVLFFNFIIFLFL